MRILHTADWHVGRTVRGRSRIAEYDVVLGQIADVARQAPADLVVVAGDLFDAGAPPPEAERVVYRTLLELSDVAPVVVVAGNHDSDRRLGALAPVLQRVRVFTRAHVARPEEGGVVEVATGSGERVKVACLPFLSQRYVVRACDLMDLDADETAQRYDDRIRRIVNVLTNEMGGDTVNLLVGHIMVVGANPGGGERAAHLATDYAVSSAAFGPQLSYVALGHVHRAQRVPAACPVWYAGSPLQLDFGDEENKPCVLLVEVQPGRPARVDQISISGSRRMLTVSGTLYDLQRLAPDLQDAWLRVVVRAERRAGLADEVRRLLPDAVDVLLDAPARAATAAMASRAEKTPGELFRAYLREQVGLDERMAELFDQLYEETLGAERAGGLAEAHELEADQPTGQSS
jgi:exonuclease SbcD